MKKLVILMFSLLVAGASFAETRGELLVSVAQKGGVAEVTFELLNDGGVVGVEFQMDLGPKFDANKAKIGTCVAGAGGISGCNIVGNELRMAVLKGDLSELETGEIGRVTLPASAVNHLQVRNLKFVDAKGIETAGQALMDVQGGAGNNRFEK
ncbi:MAG: hypothetical protein QNJ40_01930 [Xanthomonadales bacterium]|nr:hypothetical protein [Xanthomonadales bacterium]